MHVGVIQSVFTGDRGRDSVSVYWRSLGVIQSVFTGARGRDSVSVYWSLWA